MIKYIVKNIKDDTILSTEDKIEFYTFVLLNDKKGYHAYTEVYKRDKCVHKTLCVPLSSLSWFIVDVSKMFIEKKTTVEILN